MQKMNVFLCNNNSSKIMKNSQADISNKICTVKFETIFFKKYLLKHVKNLPRCNLTKL